MSETRLSVLSLLAIEHEVVDGLDFDDRIIVHQFAYLKSRGKATEKSAIRNYLNL